LIDALSVAHSAQTGDTDMTDQDRLKADLDAASDAYIAALEAASEE
jgi:hypothetical protein